MMLLQQEGIRNAVIQELPNGKISLVGEESDHVKKDFEQYELDQYSKYFIQLKSKWS